MKSAAFILSIYILLLTTIPCADSGEKCQDVSGNCAISQTHNFSHGHSEEKNDSCSPFCVCNCCHVSVLITSIIYFSKSTEVLENFMQSFYKEITSQYNCSIWQPPKA